jgi:hypothetical protein
MTGQEIAQPGPDGFTIPGIAKTIPLGPEGNCLANSKLLTRKYPEILRYQEGVLVMSFGGALRTSVRHAWNIGPTNRTEPFLGLEITYHYIPDGSEHEAERQAVAAVIGEPGPFEDDPERDGDRDAAAWLEEACHSDL